MSENKNLKSLNDRIKKRPTQGDVAKHAGISRFHLSNIIAGRRKPSAALLKKIESAYRRILG
ncbi:MAG: helix-turn-helix transcriptional regulator [Ignavibacteria bacterium]|nr:helix-turn-helix transcriptional regulator [Ignavibacteria bacterium]